MARWRASWERATASHPDPSPSKKVRTGTLDRETQQSQLHSRKYQNCSAIFGKV